MAAKGISEDQAEAKAVTQMGNPISIGQSLNRIHRPKVDWMTLILFVAALLLGFLPLLSQGYMNDNHFSMYKAIFVVLGGVLALGMMLIDYRKMANKGWMFYLLGTALLLFLTRHFNTVVDGQAVFKLGPLKMEGLMAIPFSLWHGEGSFKAIALKCGNLFFCSFCHRISFTIQPYNALYICSHDLYDDLVE